MNNVSARLKAFDLYRKLTYDLSRIASLGVMYNDQIRRGLDGSVDVLSDVIMDEIR